MSDDSRNRALDEAADLARQQAQLFRNEAHDQKQWGNREMHKRAMMIASFFDSHAAAVAALKTPAIPHTLPHTQETAKASD